MTYSEYFAFIYFFIVAGEYSLHTRSSIDKMKRKLAV